MSKKKMTPGNAIAKWTHTWHPLAFKSAMFDARLARRIDAAIRREVKKALLAKPSDRPNPYEMARPRSRKP
jgi:hypothetical protein